MELSAKDIVPLLVDITLTGIFNGALAFKAFCVAVEIGLLTSDVLSQLPNPIWALVTP